MPLKLQTKGFTLMELLCATGIIGVALPMIVLTFVNAILLNEINRSTSIAIDHAQYVMEDIKDTDTGDVAGGIDAGTWDWNATEISDAELVPLQGETIVTTRDDADLMSITVTVSWRDRIGRNRNTAATTYLSTI